MKRILIAGCSGHLGRYVVAALRGDDYFQRGLCLDFNLIPEIAASCNESISADLTKPTTLKGVCDNIDIVFSSAGASLDPRALGDRSSYYSVDHIGNRNLLAEAQRAGVKRFVYVSVFGAQNSRHLQYADAHERFVDELKSSGMSYGILRPTGFFGIFNEIFDLAVAGRAIQIGNGSSLTNPIHEADLAEACIEAMFEQNNIERDIGGPEVLTRLQTSELAFEALGKPSKVISIPPALFKMAGLFVRPINPRIYNLLEFGREVSLSKVVAPMYGKRKLAEYYRELAVNRES
ncbi:MAG: SDR family oxidoreductase [Calditrichia bacterium]